MDNVSDYIEEYEAMLDEITGVIRIGTLEFDASRVLRELDPIAYRQGLDEFIDSLSE